MRRKQAPSRAGFSLIELLVGIAMLVTLLGSAILTMNQGIGSYEQARANEIAQSKLHRAADRISRELIASGSDVLGPSGLSDEYGSATLNFQVPVDIDTNGPVWGVTQTLGFEYAPGELDDGADNNGNGLVDEGLLVLTRDAGLASAQRIVLCTNLRESFPGEVAGNFADDNGNGVFDEAGFNATLADGVLTFRLCVEVPSFDGATVVRQLTTSTRVRN